MAAAGKRRIFWYELALYAAWHMAVFNAQAKTGKLKDWPEIRRLVTGSAKAAPPKDWRVLKAQSRRQVEQLTKHRAVKARPPRIKHGR